MQDEHTTIQRVIIALERAALDRWGAGDPDGYNELSAPDITYFDPFVERRTDGAAALQSWCDQIRGQIRIDRDEMVDTKVQLIGSDAAVLTMQYISSGSEGPPKWNCTQVYRRASAAEAWKIMHTHWSFAKADA